MKDYPVRFVDIPNGERIAYRQAGQGKAVVLLHGNMSSSVHWQTVMVGLEGAFAVYAPDLRGFGDSSYNREFDSLKELSDDILRFMDALGIPEAAVAGWSTGGGVAAEMAASRPELIKKLVLLDSVPMTGYPMFKKDAGGGPILTEPLKTKADIASDPIQVIPALEAVKNGDRETMRAIWNAAIYNLRQPPAEDYEKYLDAILKQRNLVDVDYALLMFNMTKSPSLTAAGSGRLGRIQCPVSMIHGELDLVVPLAWAKASQETFGGRAELDVMPNAGHSPMTDDYNTFMNMLVEKVKF